MQTVDVMGVATRALRRVPEDVADAALAAAFLAAMVVERARMLSGERLSAAVALSVVMAGGVALRRRVPYAGYIVGSAALMAEALWIAPSPISPYANLVCLYSLGLYATQRRARWGPLILIPGVAAYFAKFPSATLTMPAGVLFTWWLAWAVGYGAARRHEEQQAARQAVRRAAVADERLRLARELHDLIGHTVNVMVVQAGAGRRVLDRDPAKTRELLTGLEHIGRDALTELDRVLGLLRRHEPAGLGDLLGTSPGIAPGIAELPRLVERMAQAGVRVTVRTDPSVSDVIPSVDLSAYRIVQEALTNALKHGGAKAVSVTVRHDGRAVDIEVCDDGRGGPAGYLPGRGLLGIAERVAAFGGSVEHGSVEHGAGDRGDRGGFRLRAVLPVP